MPTTATTAPTPGATELAHSLDRVFAWLRRRRAPSPYSMTAMYTLARLEDDGPARISDLARLEGLTQPGMTGLVNRLEDDGLVVRTAHPTDARAALVALTGTGRRWIEERRAERARAIARELEELPVAELRALLAARTALDRLTGSS